MPSGRSTSSTRTASTTSATGSPATPRTPSTPPRRPFGIVHRKIGAFRFESRFSSWVYRIAVNASIDIKRRAAARSLTSLEALQAPRDRDGGAFDVEDERTEAPTDFASRHELEKDIQRAIDRPSRRRCAPSSSCSYLESLSYDEIAETLAYLPGDREVPTLSRPRCPRPRAHSHRRPPLHSRRRSLTTARSCRSRSCLIARSSHVPRIRSPRRPLRASRSPRRGSATSSLLPTGGGRVMTLLGPTRSPFWRTVRSPATSSCGR